MPTPIIIPNQCPGKWEFGKAVIDDHVELTFSNTNDTIVAHGEVLNLHRQIIAHGSPLSEITLWHLVIYDQHAAKKSPSLYYGWLDPKYRRATLSATNQIESAVYNEERATASIGMLAYHLWSHGYGGSLGLRPNNDAHEGWGPLQLALEVTRLMTREHCGAWESFLDLLIEHHAETVGLDQWLWESIALWNGGLASFPSWGFYSKLINLTTKKSGSMTVEGVSRSCIMRARESRVSPRSCFTLEGSPEGKARCEGLAKLNWREVAQFCRDRLVEIGHEEQPAS